MKQQMQMHSRIEPPTIENHAQSGISAMSATPQGGADGGAGGIQGGKGGAEGGSSQTHAHHWGSVASARTTTAFRCSSWPTAASHRPAGKVITRKRALKVSRHCVIRRRFDAASFVDYHPSARGAAVA